MHPRPPGRLLTTTVEMDFSKFSSKELCLPNNSKARLLQLAWLPDGTHLLSLYADGAVRLWNTAGAVLAEGKCPNGLLVAAVDEESFASVSYSKEDRAMTVSVWTVAGADLSLAGSITVQEVKDSPLFAQASVDRLVVVNRDDAVRFFSLSPLSLLWSMQCDFEANQCVILEDSRLLMAAGPGHIAIIGHDGQVVDRIAAHMAAALSIAERHGLVAVGSSDATVSIWSLNPASSELELKAAIARLEWPIRCVSISHDGRFLAIGSTQDRFVEIAGMATGAALHKMPLSAPGIVALAWNPCSHVLAHASDQIDKNGRYEGIIRLFASQ